MIGCVLVAWLAFALSTPTYSCASVPEGAAGWAVGQPAPRIWIQRRWLYGLRQGIGRVTALRAKQVYVLAHELGHVEGQQTEVGANTWAHTHWRFVCRLLGADRAKARRLWISLPREWKALV